MLEGFLIAGWFHTRHLQEFIPQRNTNLAINKEEREGNRKEQNKGEGQGGLSKEDKDSEDDKDKDENKED